MKTVRLGAAALLLLIAAGCASKTAQEGDEAKQARADREEYEYRSSGIGSRIPQRVRKGEEPAANTSSSPTATMSGESLRSNTQQGIRNDSN